MIIKNIGVVKGRYMNSCKIIAMNVDKSAKSAFPLVSFNPDKCKVLSLDSYAKNQSSEKFMPDKFEANRLVNSVIKHSNDKAVLDAVRGGFESDAPNFILNLTQRVEKLTTHKQAIFLDEFTSILKKQSPDYFMELIRKSEKSLIAQNGLRKFCYYLSRLLVLAKKANKIPQKIMIV